MSLHRVSGSLPLGEIRRSSRGGSRRALLKAYVGGNWRLRRWTTTIAVPYYRNQQAFASAVGSARAIARWSGEQAMTAVRTARTWVYKEQLREILERKQITRLPSDAPAASHGCRQSAR